MRARLLLVFVWAAACGCNNPTYLAEKRPLETKAPAMGGGDQQTDTDLFVLPIRRPSDAEKKALAGEQQKLKLADPVPWAAARDLDVQIEYSVRNLDDMPRIAYVTIDGGNEFGDYVPGAYLDPTQNADEQAIPPPLLGGAPLELTPHGVATGVFREDEMQESSLNLEAITRYPNPDVRATPFRAIEHPSSISNVGRENIPGADIIPAHVRYQITVLSEGHVTLDYSVRVRDPHGKLAAPTDKNLYVSTAAMLAPPVMPPMPPMPMPPTPAPTTP